MRRIYLFTIAFLAAVQVLVSQPAAADQKQASASQQITQDLDGMTYGELQATMDATVMQLKMAIAADPDVYILEALLHTAPNPSMTKADAVRYILSMGAFDPDSKSDQLAVYRVFEKVQSELGIWDNQATAALVLKVMRYGGPGTASSSGSGLYIDEKEMDHLKSLLADKWKRLIQKDQAYVTAKSLLDGLGKQFDSLTSSFRQYQLSENRASKNLSNHLQIDRERLDQQFAEFKRLMGEARMVIGQLG